MIALLKKDWRLNRPMVIGSALTVALPYALYLGVYLFQDPRQRAGEFANIIIAAASIGLWLTAFCAVGVGGIAFAHERSDRSADFLAMLPVSRPAIVLSKAIVSICWLGLLGCANLLMMVLADYATADVSRLRWSLRFGETSLTLSASLMFFGVAWFFSTFLQSASRAAVISLVATVATMFTITLATNSIDWFPKNDALWLATIALGAASLMIGTVHYVLRVEP